MVPSDHPRSFRISAWLCMLVCLHAVVLAPPAFAQPGPKRTAATERDLIEKGQLQFDDQQYEESIQTLSAALLRPNNTPVQRVEVYRLLALNYITLGRQDEAENAVRGLLVQKPDYDIPAKESPRFRDFFAQARAKWEAEGRPGILKEQPVRKSVILKHSSPARVEAGTAVELRARLEDADRLTSRVKLFYRSGTKGEFTEARATVEGSTVRVSLPSAAIKPPVVDYYFEAVDSSGAFVAGRGDASSPLRIPVPEATSKGWVLPVAIGGGVLGAAAIVGVLALAGVFKSQGGSEPGPGGRPMSTVTVNVGEASR